MQRSSEASERAKELAANGCCESQIVARLKAEGYGSLPDLREIERIVVEARTALAVYPGRPARLLPRLVGIVAVLLGIGAMTLGATMPEVRGRVSPFGIGGVALILGVVLIVRPGSSAHDADW